MALWDYLVEVWQPTRGEAGGSQMPDGSRIAGIRDHLERILPIYGLNLIDDGYLFHTESPPTPTQIKEIARIAAGYGLVVRSPSRARLRRLMPGRITITRLRWWTLMRED